MKLTIRLRYTTHFGQTLLVCGNHKLLGDGRPDKALPLHYVNQEYWETTLDWPAATGAATPVNYYFILREASGAITMDFGQDRRLELDSPGSALIVDSWNDPAMPDNAYYTEPFRNVLLRVGNDDSPAKVARSFTHRFRVKAPLLPAGQTICLLGSARSLDTWKTESPMLLRRCAARGCFVGELGLGSESFPIAYKYGIYDTVENKFVRYEEGENRLLTEAAIPRGRVIINDGRARLPSAPWRGAGVAIPVFSLRSEKGFGVGEFLDLIPLADWARQAGLKLIQILPVNDTIATHSWLDSYPYNSISAFALHPVYLNLDRLAPLPKSLEAERKKLNALPVLDYEAVMKAKMAFLREVFPKLREQTLSSAGFRGFFAQNQPWLEPYAAFCVLRDKYGTSDFRQWPEHRDYDQQKISKLEARDEFDLLYFIQYQLHLQLREAVEYLHAHGIVLKGDIAIGVNPNGADVWQQPDLFHLDMQTGAPPDAFAAKGQNWGFPTYNWPRMQRDGFAWWKQRFAQMSNYFDAFRIDHILGFFRIWSIPRTAVEGILGYFVPALPVEDEEFAARGIPFNRERFARPFINNAVLHELFDDGADRVKREFLNPPVGGEYSFKSNYATQASVEKYFATLEKSRENEALRLRLFDLLDNVILIETPAGDLHFRFDMEHTSSFLHLDALTQARLRELYIDYFYRRQEDFWMGQALQKLPALQRVTDMLICGEDLGMVPACVPVVMKRLGLLSLEIQRMPKRLQAEFSRPSAAPYLSVVTPSTHDMSTIRGWWCEDRRRTQLFFKLELHQPGDAPAECEPWIAREIIRQHLESPAMWSIFQLQDLFAIDTAVRRDDIDAERINIPAIVPYYWRYRMHLPLEKLGRARVFTQLVNDFVRQSGR